MVTGPVGVGMLDPDAADDPVRSARATLDEEVG